MTARCDLAGFAVLAIVIAAQAMLAFLSPSMSQASMHTPGDVLLLLALTMLPAGIGLAYALKFLDALTPSRRLLGIIFMAGLAVRLVWIGAPGPMEDDFNRYLWDGAVVAAGENPYRVAPEAAANAGPVLQGLAREGAPVVGSINFADLTTIYPGVAQAAFVLAHWLAPWRLDGLRLVFIAADAATLLLLIALLRDYGRSPLWAGLYWLDPLVVFCTTATAHADALLPPLAIGALLAASRQRWIASGVLMGLAAGVKIWPVLLAPVFLRAAWGRARPAQIVLASLAGFAIAAIALLPLVAASGEETSGLKAYAEGWANNNAPFAWVIWALDQLYGEMSDGPERAFRIVVAAGAAVAAIATAIRPITTAYSLGQRVLALTAILFYLSPAQFPWYALMMLALAAVFACGPLLAASVTLPLYYLSFGTEFDTYQNGLALLHAVPVWLWLAWQGIERSRQRVVPA